VVQANTFCHSSDVAIGLGQLITGCVLAQNGVSVGGMHRDPWSSITCLYSTGQAVANGNNDIAIQLGRSEQSYWSP
jgi:hypothetical protein